MLKNIIFNDVWAKILTPIWNLMDRYLKLKVANRTNSVLLSNWYRYIWPKTVRISSKVQLVLLPRLLNWQIPMQAADWFTTKLGSGLCQLMLNWEPAKRIESSNGLYPRKTEDAGHIWLVLGCWLLGNHEEFHDGRSTSRNDFSRWVFRIKLGLKRKFDILVSGWVVADFEQLMVYGSQTRKVRSLLALLRRPFRVL